MLKPNPYRILVAGLAGIGIAVATLHSQDSGRGLAGREWSAVSGDLGNTRYSTLTQVNKDTLAKLRGAWTSARFDDGGGGRAMPVVKDGLVFITAGSYVYVYDARTGATVWKHQTGASPPSPGLTDFTRPEQGLPAREGVAVGDGLVFVGLSNAHVIALREKTGEQVWDVYGGIDPPRPGQGVSGAPLYAGGLVFVGTSADPGFRGKVVAVDAKTGRKAWEWFAVPGPGDPGHDTWPKDNDAWKIGGGALWLVGAADPELGLVYFGTGNGVPQYAGDLRAGDNLHLCSLVALDIKTGKLKWYYQTIRHDIWEADIAQSPVVYDAQIAGRTRKLVAAMRTDGVLFVLDRETGKPVQQIEERKVPQDPRSHTVATQPYPVGADRMLPDCDEWSKEKIPAGFTLGCFFAPASLDVPNLLTPAWGMRVTPMAYSPQTGYFYALGNASLQWFRRAEDPYVFILGGGRVPGMPAGHGVMAAIDGRTGKIAWKKDFSGPRPSGALATASGLLFQTMPDGNLIASDAQNGQQIWQFQSGATGGGGPAVTYDVDGEQYIAVGMRNNVMAFKLNGPIEAKPQPEAAPRPIPTLFAGQIQDTNKIEIASYVRDSSQGGTRMYVDEYAFNVYRARVKAGTPVRWVNNGRMNHTIAAEDGSWTTPRLSPLEAAAVTFDKPGEYTYMCKEHPWAKAQIIVTP